MQVSDPEDIWSGGSIQRTDPDPNYKYDPYKYKYMELENQRTSDNSGCLYAVEIVACIIFIIAALYFSVMGPSLWHNKLVVCHGTTQCTEYSEWKVINENSETGVLEVWAGGRLQRLSNGTWHYE